MPIPHNANTFTSSLGDAKPSSKRVISYAANQSVRPYSTNQEYLYAMREDLADWLKGLYAIDINVENFFEVLETGTLLCQHANNITTCAQYMRDNKIKVHWKYVTKYPEKLLNFNQGKYVRKASFFARDNIASFIGWCRNELDVAEAVMFETNDLVLRYSEKNVILCLLEVARRGSKFGVPAPVLVQMEEEIDEEIEMEKVAKEQNEPPPKPVKQKVNCDFKSLDEMVQYILGMCTCPSQFPMVRVSDGKYKVGDSENLIFMRILRQHVMVRVGGGWDTLEHYLNKHDPCRCQKHKADRSLTPRFSRSQSSLSVAQPHHRSRGSTEDLRKPLSPRNKQLAASGRISRSTTDLTSNVKLGGPELRRLSSRSKNSSTSDTSSTDKRPLTARKSQPVEKTVVKNTPNKKERLSLQPDVFSRLSRPKSTPPINRSALVPQADLLLVQRNKKGSHQVARSSVPGSAREQNEMRRRTRSSDNTQPSSKSTTGRFPSKQIREPPLSNSKTSSKRTSAQGSQGSVGSSRPSTARTPRVSQAPVNRSRSKSATREMNTREQLKLDLSEKEQHDSKPALHHNKLKTPPRQTSIDSSLDSQRFSSSVSSEDNEVALHMQSLIEPEPRPFRPPPSSYHLFSLPRPRKDKREQHERPTRIPTPISFNKPLHTSRSTDSKVEKSPKEITNKPSIVSDEVFEQIERAEQKKMIMNCNGTIQGTPSPRLDIRQPRTSIPLDKINRLLNSGKFNFENGLKSNGENTPKGRPSIKLNSSFLHSSGHHENGHNPPMPAFAPIESPLLNGRQPQQTDLNGETTLAYSDQPHRPLSNGQTDSYRPGFPRLSSSEDFDDDVSCEYNVATDVNMNSILPAHMLKACGFSPKLYLGSEVKKQNGLRVRTNSTRDSRKEQFI